MLTSSSPLSWHYPKIIATSFTSASDPDSLFLFLSPSLSPPSLSLSLSQLYCLNLFLDIYKHL